MSGVDIGMMSWWDFVSFPNWHKNNNNKKEWTGWSAVELIKPVLLNLAENHMAVLTWTWKDKQLSRQTQCAMRSTSLKGTDLKKK